MQLRLLALAGAAIGVDGHGYVLSPPPRASAAIPGAPEGSAGSCAAGVCVWFNDQCTIGCPSCGPDSVAPYQPEPIAGGTCPEFPGHKSRQGNATLGLRDPARTFNIGKPCGISPWCAPGTAPTYSPCGLSSGGPQQNSNDGGFLATKVAARDPVSGKGGVGWPAGTDGLSLPELKQKTIWRAGSVEEIQWALIANHGGGYQYRLCSKKPGVNPTEECFQATPIEFHGEEQYIQWCANEQQFPMGYGGNYYVPDKPFPRCDPRNRTAFKATYVNEGVVPKGSTWMRNPIPAYAAGGEYDPGSGNASADFQFPPLMPDRTRPGKLLGGFGGGRCKVGVACKPGDPNYRRAPAPGIPPIYDNHCAKGSGPGTGIMMDVCPSEAETRAEMFQWNIVDKIVVPQVPPGDYIMSFRWDCEGTQQVWSSCSDVTITA